MKNSWMNVETIVSFIWGLEWIGYIKWMNKWMNESMNVKRVDYCILFLVDKNKKINKEMNEWIDKWINR